MALWQLVNLGTRWLHIVGLHRYKIDIYRYIYRYIDRLKVQLIYCELAVQKSTQIFQAGEEGVGGEVKLEVKLEINLQLKVLGIPSRRYE